MSRGQTLYGIRVSSVGNHRDDVDEAGTQDLSIERLSLGFGEKTTATGQQRRLFDSGTSRQVTVEPDIVLLFVNPAQADRILGLISFDGAEPFMYYPASSICSTITNALAKGKPEMNLVSYFERRRRGAGWAPDELLLALPLTDFEAAVKNIPESGFGTAVKS